MPRNEEGEFELVLGNKQLLSVFFIVIVLLGVFFAMGWIMGRNAGPTTLAEQRMVNNGLTDHPIVVDGGAPSRPSAAGDPVKREPVVKPVEKTVEPPKIEEPVKKPEPKKPEPEKTVERKAETPRTPQSVGGANPPAGLYLQVAAVKMAEAEVVAKLVASRGYKAWLMPKPDSDIIRVVVGPAKDKADQSKMGADLEEAGFKKPFPRKL